MRRVLLVLLCCLTVFLQNAVAQITFTSFPQDFQLVPRVGDERTAVYHVKGRVTGATTGRRLSAKLLQGTKLVDSVSQVLAYVNDTTSFDLAINIPVTRANHTLQVTIDGAIRATAQYLVAGDVYMVNGQSNAEGLVVIREADRDSFLRGPRYLGVGWAQMQFTRAGMWMGRTARELSAQRDVPVAAFNFAVGAQGIDFFRKDHLAVDGNFEAAQDTLRKYDVDGRVRGLIWFQGETDAFSYFAERYRRELDALFDEYQADFGIPRYYAFQTRTFSCSATRPNVMEGQRQLSAEREDFDLMSTMNAKHLTDGCHYFGDGGYDVLGTRMAEMIIYRENGSVGSAQVLPPDVDSARITGLREISVWFNTHGAGLATTGNPYPEFRAEGPGFRPNGGRVDGDRLVLTFAENVTAATGITYLSHSGPAPDYVHSAAGPGVLTFHDYSFVRGDGDVGNLPDARITLASAQQTLSTNGQLAATLTLYNEGLSTLRSTDVTMPTPMGLNFIGGQSTIADATIAFNIDQATWSVPRVPPGDSAVLEFSYFVRNYADSITLWAQISDVQSRDEDSRSNNGTSGIVTEDDEARLFFGNRARDCVLSAEAGEVDCLVDAFGAVFSLRARDAKPSALTISGPGIPAGTNWLARTPYRVVVTESEAVTDEQGRLRFVVTKVSDPTCATAVAVLVPQVCTSSTSTLPARPSLSELHTYPNPIRSGNLLRFTLDEADGFGEVAVQLWSVTGQRVPLREIYRESATTMAAQIDAAAGMYVVVVGQARQLLVVVD